MKRRIFTSICGVALLVFIACFLITLTAAYNYYAKQHMQELRTEAYYLAAAIEDYGTDFLDDLQADSTSRVTHIGADGTVLYDSAADSDTMENHLNREEVREAFETGVGESARYSSTLSEKTSNYAVLLQDNTVLRISSSHYSVLMLVRSLAYHIVLVIILAVLLSLFFAARISNSLLRPINNLDLTAPDEKSIYPELRPLAERLNAQNRQIDRQMEELRMEHERQDKLRREFTANVSHELKTPLTSISGYAEIIRNGLVAPEDVGRFSGKIYDESQRLITLVGDILDLSKLEDKDFATEKMPVDLYQLAEDVIGHLTPMAEKKQVSFSLEGGSVKMLGAERILEEIVYNLCDNAIKYNKEGGSVTVRVTAAEGCPALSVTDTGIGIPEEELDRVFERFYRVNKSHSKEIGGTGLGLSIVKHGAAYHNAEIRCSSTLGEGTTIEIVFPKSE